MFLFKKLTLLASLFMVGMLLLAACGVEESTPTPLPAIATPAATETALPGPIVLPIGISDQFLEPQSYPTGDLVWGFALADLDGDSFMDLAVGDEILHGVRVFLNNQVGGFQEVVEYATGEGSIHLIAADLNGDSFPDLAASNSGSATLSVLLNQGNGSFQPPVDYAASDQPAYLTAADFDKDTDLDLVVGYKNMDEWGGVSASVWLNNGDGTFQDRENFNAKNIHHWVAGDLDGDSYPDLVGRSYVLHEVGVLLNKGDATFKPAVYYRVGDIYDITITDLDDDSYADLAVYVAPNFVKILLNNGDGSFQESLDYVTENRIFKMAASDLNGDSYPEIIVTSNNLIVSVLWNTGDGTFNSREDYRFPAVYGNQCYVDLVDVDGDSFLDLAVSCNKGVHVFLNKGSD